MSDMAERLINPISTDELERRWSAVRAAMATQKIDVLVMQNSNEFSGGYVKWFTDMPSGNGTMTTVIFPKDDLMTVVAPGPFGIDVKPPAGEASFLMGALKITFGGSSSIRMGDLALSCADPVAMPTSRAGLLSQPPSQQES